MQLWQDACEIYAVLCNENITRHHMKGTRVSPSVLLAKMRWKSHLRRQISLNQITKTKNKLTQMNQHAHSETLHARVKPSSVRALQRLSERGFLLFRNLQPSTTLESARIIEPRDLWGFGFSERPSWPWQRLLRVSYTFKTEENHPPLPFLLPLLDLREIRNAHTYTLEGRPIFEWRPETLSPFKAHQSARDLRKIQPNPVVAQPVSSGLLSQYFASRMIKKKGERRKKGEREREENHARAEQIPKRWK